MTVCREILHIHVPKTAGQTVRLFLNRHVGVKEWMVTHAPLSRLQAMARSHYGVTPPSFKVVRNPWDWYVSRYFHVMRMRHEEQPPRTVSAVIELTPNSPEGFREHMRILEEIKDGDGVIRDTKGNPVDAGRTWWHLTLTAWEKHLEADRADFTVRYEHLAEDMADLMGKFVPRIPRERVLGFFRQTRINASRHPDGCWTPELVAKVAESWDGEYAERHGYDGPEETR